MQIKVLYTFLVLQISPVKLKLLERGGQVNVMGEMRWHQSI